MLCDNVMLMGLGTAGSFQFYDTLPPKRCMARCSGGSMAWRYWWNAPLWVSEALAASILCQKSTFAVVGCCGLETVMMRVDFYCSVL